MCRIRRRNDGKQHESKNAQHVQDFGRCAVHELHLCRYGVESKLTSCDKASRMSQFAPGLPQDVDRAVSE
jgi:hypothetical protein